MKVKNKNMIYTLLLSCLALASCRQDSYTPSPEEDVKKSGDVTLYVTTNNRSYDFQKTYLDFSTKFNMSPNTITVNPATQYQTMDGFGVAITGSSCYNLMKMSKENRTKFLTETFSDKDGAGMSYVRIAIGCSDFSLSEYTCWDTPGRENFSLQSEEKQYIIPILKEILAINPNLKILGSPWTPPRWMKVNDLTNLQAYNSWTGGQLNPTYYNDYAWYFVKWLQAFKAEGINVGAITPQNEPLNKGNSASLYMPWQDQLAFIKQALGPQLQQAGLGTKIYVFDHNYNYDNNVGQAKYPINIYNDATAASYITGSAWHDYGGGKDELLSIHASRPDKEVIFTESSIGEWNDGRNLAARLMADMSEIALGTVRNWSKAVMVWNLMLDSDKGPNRPGGCETCYGSVDIQKSNYRGITRNSHFYIIAHLSAVVKPGAKRIDASGYTADGLQYLAFQNTDGSFAIVMLNDSGENRNITISDGKNHYSYNAPAKSVVSYRWTK